MAVTIPFIPSENNYDLGVPLGDQRVWFDTRWNSYERAWYFDLYDDAHEVIAIGVKVVLGVELGRQSTHPFFKRHVLKAIDTSGAGSAPGVDDLGGRVQVIHTTVEELFAE